MARLAGATALGVGKSQVPVLLDPQASAREDVLFARRAGQGSQERLDGLGEAKPYHHM